MGGGEGLGGGGEGLGSGEEVAQPVGQMEHTRSAVGVHSADL